MLEPCAPFELADIAPKCVGETPRRTVRFKRGVIIAIAALGSGTILGVT